MPFVRSTCTLAYTQKKVDSYHFSDNSSDPFYTPWTIVPSTYIPSDNLGGTFAILQCPGVITVLSGGLNCDYTLSVGDFSATQGVQFRSCPGVQL